MKRFILGALFALLCLAWTTAAIAGDQTGNPTSDNSALSDINCAYLFEVHCAGCHPHGGNIIRRGKTLKSRALKRNRADNLDAIASLIANGKNTMSAFRDRLTDPEIQALSAYVLQRAEEDWRS